MCVCLRVSGRGATAEICTDPSAQQDVAALLQLQVGGQIGPDDVGRVEALPQLGAALEDEVDDEELDARVHG